MSRKILWSAVAKSGVTTPPPSGIVYALPPNDSGWSYVYDAAGILTSADIPGFGANTAPFVGMAPPWPEWYPAFEVSLPGGLSFTQDGAGGYTLLSPNALYSAHWFAKEIELVDLSTVYFAFEAKEAYINDVLWDGFPMTPISTTLKITLLGHSTGSPGAYMYFNAAVWQDII